MSLPLTKLVIDPSLQMRAGGLNDEHVEDLAEAVRENKRLPYVRVRHVKGRGRLVTDGFHTVEAHRRAGKAEVRAVVRPGTWEEAVLDAAGANQEHRGLKRTNADKRRAVEMVIELFPDWSAGRIALAVGVSDQLVLNVRNGSAPTVGCSPSADRKTVGRDGKARGPRHAALPPAAAPTDAVSPRPAPSNVEPAPAPPPPWWEDPAAAVAEVKSALRKLRDLQYIVSAVFASPLKGFARAAQADTRVIWANTGEHFVDAESPHAQVLLRKYDCDQLDALIRFLATLVQRLDGRGPPPVGVDPPTGGVAGDGPDGARPRTEERP